MRTGNCVSLYALLALLVGFRGTTLAQYDSRAIEPHPPLEGSLFLHGGGLLEPEMRSLFVKLAGGKQSRIVVISSEETNSQSDSPDPQATSEQHADGELSPTCATHSKLDEWNASEASRVELLQADSREAVASLDCDDLLDQATAVWICSDRRARLIDVYAGTKVEVGIHRLLARGGLVGATSAGTAIASGITLLDNEELKGFNLIPGTIVEQHYLPRNKSVRLRNAVDRRPDHVGFGIDEKTVLVIRGRQMEVVGALGVTVMIAASASRPARTEKLKHGDTADLVALRRTAQARQSSPFPTEHVVAPKLEKGSLFIAGGGVLPSEAMAQFIQLAGGEKAKIVYIPCEEAKAIVREPGMVRELRRAGAGQVDWLHTKDRRLANEPEFVAKLADATGVWFGGGRQWNLVDSYQNTEAHRLMHLVLERGGVIGGSSAGASIQGEYMPRGDPLGNTNMMAEGYERGLGFLHGVAIDQHFSQRNRFVDMALLKRTFPQLLGIGIDEGTCMVVTGSRAKAIGPGKIAFYDQPVGSNSLEMFTHVTADETYDLEQRQRVRERE